jgi:hypothetical protein
MSSLPPKEFEHVKAFVKDESYAQYKHVRGIYSRSDGFKVLFGPLIKLIEDQVYKFKYFIKHVPVRDRPKFVYDRLYLHNATYISTDYTAFESHFTKDMMESCEFILYRHMYRFLPNKGFYDYCLDVLSGLNIVKFKWITTKFEARRMSGEMNTSLGNGFTNLMVFLFLNRADPGADCVIEGDDCLGRVKRVPTSDEYKSLGFNVKIEKSFDLSRAAFCSMYFDVENFVNVVDPLKVIMKLGWCSAKFVGCSKKTRLELLKGKVMSMMSECIGAPMLQALGIRLLKLLHKSHYRLDHLTSFEREKFDPKFTPRDVPMSSRLIVEEIFGFSIEEQLSFERDMDEFQLGPITHPVILSHLNRDAVEFYDSYVAPYRVGGRYPVLRVPRIVVSSGERIYNKNGSKISTTKDSAFPKLRRRKV